MNDEGLSQGHSPGNHPGSHPVSPLPHEAAQGVIARQEFQGHLFVVVVVICAAVGLRLDHAIDVPTVSSVLIGALGYATGLTAGKARTNGH